MSGWRKPAVVRERTRSGKETRAIADAFRSHGGLTPAAPTCRFAGRRRTFDAHRTAFVSRTTAG
jgi:hypothetical protein